MNRESLECFIRIYENSSEIILIMDQDWKPLWSKNTAGIKEGLSMKHIPSSFWGSMRYPLLIRNELYECRLSCSQQDGLRIAHFLPISSCEALDLTALSCVIQGMISTCTAMHRDLEEYFLHRPVDYLNVLFGDILRVYRMTFLQKQINNGRMGSWTKNIFDVRSALHSIYERLRSILRHIATVTLDDYPDQLLVECDDHSFSTFLSSVFILCVKKPEMMQNIHISLKEENKCAVIDLSVEPDREKRHDLDNQLYSFGGLDGEHQLIELYSMTYDIQTMFKDTGTGRSCRMVIPLCQNGTVISLHSSIVQPITGYFDPVTVVLARLRYNDYF